MPENESCSTAFHLDISFICKAVIAQEIIIFIWKILRQNENGSLGVTRREIATSKPSV